MTHEKLRRIMANAIRERGEMDERASLMRGAIRDAREKAG